MSNMLKKRIRQETSELLDGARFRYIDNGAKVLAIAHCDYVDCGSAHYFRRDNLVWSSRLDDRLGIHVILDLLPKMGVTVDVLLTDDEETGNSTASLFKPDKQYNWMFQFDRHGETTVCYEYDEMASYAAGYFRMGQGSFSDICRLEHLKCGGMNVGTSYQNEHTLGSYADMGKLAQQLTSFGKFHEKYCDTYIGGIDYDGGYDQLGYDEYRDESEYVKMYDTRGGYSYVPRHQKKRNKRRNRS